MNIKGNGVYGDIEVNTRNEAIEVILRCLNGHQIGWEVVYVDQLLKEFNISKDDFAIYELSLYYGAYSAFYKPRYTEDELEVIRKDIENKYTLDLIKNLSREIEECMNCGMSFDSIKGYFNLNDLENASKATSYFLKNNRKNSIELVSAKENVWSN